MKKTLYTLSFVALFAIAGTAQNSQDQPKQDPAKRDHVNHDGTAAPASQNPDQPRQEPAAKQKSTSQNADQAPANSSMKNASSPDQPKDRHAITDKGVPAAKNKSGTNAQPESQPKKDQPVKGDNK
jgi:hypothetical protein